MTDLDEETDRYQDRQTREDAGESERARWLEFDLKRLIAAQSHRSGSLRRFVGTQKKRDKKQRRGIKAFT